MDSPLSSVVSISGVPSDISDINEQTSSTHLNNQTDPLVVDLNGQQLFDSGDGDMELVFNGTRFETHRYLIKRFKKWTNITSKLQSDSVMTITGTASSEDFGRMLKVLYSTTLEGPFEFDTQTLVSALHIATDYGYPTLRDYTIRQLERTQLTAIKRIEIARKFGLPSWEEPAYLDLCNRDEPITEEEASVLGLAAFVRVAKIREKEQRRRGKAVDAGQEEEAPKSKVENVNEVTISSLPGDQEPPKEIHHPSGSAESQTTGSTGATDSDGAQDSVKTSESESQPSFLDIEVTKKVTYNTGGKPRIQVGLPVPGCSCSYKELFGPKSSCPCMLPACAVSAFKHIQVEQLAHKRSITDLQSSVSELYSMSESKPGSAGEQKVETSNRAVPMHEEIQVMLRELSRKSPGSNIA
ncbi:hypothetical protein RSOLAG22IIIB_02433 [Rhizoctonia solani]|uniref:BTB domain-containing protein n=1 Tax=Rhizoctonia solani TaxID=456999 RepID=A0A0K6GFY9_9AGAM|nr:hypothetical protein RSOLAG22IIIB_02433 [Rhizoctonia solani]